MNRRQFLLNISFMAASAAALNKSLFSQTKSENGIGNRLETMRTYDKIIAKATENGWNKLPIGELMGNIGLEFAGTPYVGGTLDLPGPEICRADFTGLDCVTFYESVLTIARILKKGKSSFDDFISELTFIRYRDGNLTNYSSRLHYTADWLDDNIKKEVVKDITKSIGGILLPNKVSFMSRNPKYYSALKNDTAMVKKIMGYETEINSRQHYYLPKALIKKNEKKIKTGDIIAVATNKAGLDYAHTGLAYMDKNGSIRLLHASSAQKKVVLDKPIHEYLASIPSDIGITVARALKID